MRSFGVVVDPPCFDDLTCLVEIGEQVLVEALVSEPTVEALDKAILHRFAWRDVVPFDIAILLPRQDGVRGELGAVVADHHARADSGLDDAIELAYDPWGSERGIDYQAEALPGAVIDQGEDA